MTEIDGKMSIPAASNTLGKTIADQLVEAGKTWKSYQESVTFSGADLVNYGDGYYDNTSNLSTLLPGATNIAPLQRRRSMTRSSTSASKQEALGVFLGLGLDP